MKKNIFLALVLVAFFGVMFTSCETESADTSLIGSSTNNGGSGNTATGGDYQPLAVGNRWISKITEEETGQVERDTVTITGTQMENGYVYYLSKSTSMDLNSGSSSSNTIEKIRKENNLYFSKKDPIHELPSAENMWFGTKVTGTTDLVYLKQNASVGTTWQKNYGYTITRYSSMFPMEMNQTINIVENYTMMERDQTVTVNGHTYQNVIKIKMVQEVTNSSIPGTLTTTMYTWLALNVGTIKAKAYSPDGKVYNGELESYIVN